MLNKVGVSCNNLNLEVGDICSFTIDKKEYEGIIKYSENDFAFSFEMQDPSFPSVYMMKADLNSIKRIINVSDTKDGDRFGFYRSI